MGEYVPSDGEAVRRHLISMFNRMDEMGLVFHPWVMEDAWRMAELLGVDTSTVPTEGRAVAGRQINRSETRIASPIADNRTTR